MELAHSFLLLLEGAGPNRRKMRALLISSPLFTQALQGLRAAKVERRIKALHALAKLDGAEVVRPLLSQLEAEEEAVREEAIKGLASLHDGRAVELLLSLWSAHPLELVAEALVRHGPTIIPKVGPLVTHRDHVIRYWAVEVLKQLQAPEVAPFLSDALRDSQVVVRANAARALGEVGSKEVQPLISLLRRDPAYEVRVQAGESLTRVGGPHGKVALQEAFLDLGEEYLPWDAAVQLWRTYVSCLEKVDGLHTCLRRASTLPAEAFGRWLLVGATACDIRTLILGLHYLPEAQSRQVCDALDRAVVMHGEEAILQGVIQLLSRPGLSQVAALKALDRMHLSCSSMARLSAELSPLLQASQEEVRSRAQSLVSRWEQTLPPAFGAPEKLKVFLADESRLFRQGVRLILEVEGVDVVGEAETAEEAQSLLPEVPQEAVIFCSTGLPGHDGLLARLNKERPDIAVVFVQEASDGDGRHMSFQETPFPYITRACTSETVLSTLYSLADGAEFGEPLADPIPSPRTEGGPAGPRAP